MKKKPIKKKKEAPDLTWTTRDGSILKIKDMRDSHLLNAHRMLRRQRLLGPHMKSILALEAEIERREMEALPVFLDSVDEASHIVKRTVAAVEAANKLKGLAPYNFMKYDEYPIPEAEDIPFG